MFIETKLIAAVATHAAKKDVRYYLNAVLFEVKGGRLYIVATDGHRMAFAKVDASGESDHSFLVPLETVLQIIKHKGEKVAIELDGDKVKANVNGADIAAPVVDGRFPDWRRVVPANGWEKWEFTESRTGTDGGALTFDSSDLIVNAEYLAEYAKVGRLLKTGKFPAVSIRQQMAGHYVVCLHGRPDFCAVVMGIQPSALDMAILPTTA